jgi:prepilin-type N-terminal cleavage/methylation domain-containing protein
MEACLKTAGFANLKEVKETKMKKKRKGFTLVELLVVIAIIALLMGILMPALARVRQIAFRMVCGSNLSGLGRAMLIYANDYDNDLPRAGFVDTVWSNQTQWNATDRTSAHMGNPGEATVSSSFYLLVKYAEVTPKSFICKGESNVKAFKTADYASMLPNNNYEDEDAWDFGPNPTYACCYSYHMPYTRRALSTASSEPGMAIAADRNPYQDPSVNTDNFRWDDFSRTGPPDDIKHYQRGNAGPHQREGQNVLFMDNHVYFEKQSFCGVDEDNIYTYQSSGPIQQGAPPPATANYSLGQPVFAKDSFLVNEWLAGTSTPGPPPPPPPPVP